MGGSSSQNTITNRNNTLIVDKSDIKVLNEQINNTSSNVAVEQAKSCSSETNISNMINLSHARIQGDLNIGTDGNNPSNKCSVELDSDVNVTFQCTQVSQVSNQMGISMIDTIMQQLQNNVSNDVLNDMNNIASAKAKAGSLSFGGSSSTSNNVETINDYKSITETHKDLENVVRNSVEANFSSKDAQKCINKVNQSQGIDASGSFVGGNANICNFKSSVAANVFTSCMQESDIGNKITEDITRNLGITVTDTKSNTIENKTKSETTAESITTSVFEDIGTGIGNAIGGLFSLFGLGALIPFAIPIAAASCVCCCCVLVILLLSVGLLGGSSNYSYAPYSSTSSQYGGVVTSSPYVEYNGNLATSTWNNSATSY